MFRKLQFTFLLMLVVFSSFAGDTARVLFIGNSLTGVNDLPAQTVQLAASKGDVVIPGYDVIGGALISTHLSNAQSLQMIDSGIWTHVVIQEQSQVPAFPDVDYYDLSYPYAKTICTLIRQKNPCAKILFYMTWGYQNGDQSNCAAFAPLCTYETMDSMLRLRYILMADSNNAAVCPAGATIRYIRNMYPGINPYDPDGYHPSMEGTYAAACSFYAAIFGKNPYGAPYTSSLNLSDAANIQTAAKTVAFDSLSYWSQWWLPTTSYPLAGFNQSVNGRTVQFINTSVYANSYYWSFGNGVVSSLANPTYTYPANGTYTVKLISSSCGNKDSIQKTITVSNTSVNSIATGTPAPVAYPNPFRHTLQLDGLNGRYSSLEISDMIGKVVKSTALPDIADHVSLPLPELPKGIYILKLSGNSGSIALKIVKE